MPRPQKRKLKASDDPMGWKAAAKAWRPPPLLTFSQMAESGLIHLPDGTTADPGPYRLGEMPYWRQVLDWIGDRDTEEVYACTGAQHGKTTMLQAALLCASVTDPGPVLMLMPTDDMAEEFMRDRFRPMIQASPGIAKRVPRGRTRDAARVDGVSWDNGGYLNITGMASSNKVKGKPVRILGADEWDEGIKYCTDLGDMRGRCRTRLRTFAGRSKLVITSTPTGEDVGIWVLWQEAQQWGYFVPCPDCGHFQQLIFAHVIWPRDEDGNHPDPEEIYRERSARYQCEACESLWTDGQKHTAVKAGRWECLTPERGGLIKGIHLNSLYSPVVSLSWAAREYLLAMDNGQKMIQFRNETLAEPQSRSIATSNTKELVLQARQEWKQGLMPGDGDVPEDVQAIVAGADVQGNHLWATFVGVGPDSHWYPLWAGRCPDMATLEEWSRKPWICHSTGEEIQVSAGFIDSGYRTQEVYAFCQTSAIWKACKGSHENPMPIKASQVTRGSRGRTIGGDLVFLLAPTYFKDMVDSALGQSRLHLPADMPEVYLKHVTAEVKKMVRTNSGSVFRWVPRFTGAANHLLDATCYAFAAAQNLGLINMTRRTQEERKVQREAKAMIQGAAQSVGLGFSQGLGFRPFARS